MRGQVLSGALAAALLLPPFALLGGCSSGGGGQPVVSPAPQAASPACAAALAQAPATVLGRARRDLGVAGALAWGDPAVVLRCGVPDLGPTSDPCLGVDGVDWVLTSPDSASSTVLRTFGRTPGLELTVPAQVGRENATAVAATLAPVARSLTRRRGCIGAGDAP